MDNQQCVNRRRRRNLPAELKVEIVDCLPLENAVNFLANVPNRLTIRYCAPRLRRMLKMIDQIATGYARTLPAPANSNGYIWLDDGHKYTPELDIFLRYGATHCRYFFWRVARHHFVGYPVNFFNDLIKHYYETKVPKKAVHNLRFELCSSKAAPWPAALVQPQAGEIKLEELEVNNASYYVRYILHNQHNPSIALELRIDFQRDAKRQKKMRNFTMKMVDVKSAGGGEASR